MREENSKIRLGKSTSEEENFVDCRCRCRELILSSPTLPLTHPMNFVSITTQTGLTFFHSPSSSLLLLMLMFIECENSTFVGCFSFFFRFSLSSTLSPLSARIIENCSILLCFFSNPLLSQHFSFFAIHSIQLDLDHCSI